LRAERLDFGGATTVRGYERDQADALDILAAFGADIQILVLNQELRFPLFGDLRGVAFVDYGQAWASLSGLSATEVRVGTGLGLRYSTAVGVLRLDAGYPLRGDDRKVRFYFGLGQAF
jgi:translocation and assembly module TamA